MSSDKGKISVRQALVLMILYFCSPAVRYIPSFTTKSAHNAAWLAPFVAGIFLVIYMILWSKIIEKYKDKSLVDILKDSLGKVTGTIISIIYALWITFYIAYGTRVYAERLLVSAMSDISIYVLVGVMLLSVGYIIKNGIVLLARMGEIFFIILVIIFVVYNVMIIPEIKVSNFFPVTYKDTFGILKASLSMISLFGSGGFIFFFNDKIDHKGDFKRLSIKAAILSAFIFFLMIVVSLGVFGWEIISNMPVPYINTMMQVSLFDVIERIELGMVVFWIIADFTMVSACIYAVLNILKNIFKLPKVTPLSNIFIVGLYFFCLVIGTSALELQAFAQSILTPGNIILGYSLPIVILIVGKLRKKI